MEAKPVKRIADPRYPTRLEVLADRELLEKHMPAAWKSCAEIASAAAILLTVNNCWAQQPLSGNVKTKAIVAPIFEHGEGRASDGCMVVNPPVFLSEQDAMQVIREELQKSGVILSDEKVILFDGSISQDQKKLFENIGKNIQTGKSKPPVLQNFDPKTGKIIPVVRESYDPRKKVGIAVVDKDDYHELGGAPSASSVQSYNFKKVAQEVRDLVATKDNDLYFGIFYDPTGARGKSNSQTNEFSNKLRELRAELQETTDPTAKQQKSDEIKTLMKQSLDPKQESRRLLRMQVKDFIDWLKGQGVI
jgi:hypothetical protein